MSLWAIIPVKPLRKGKSRLSGVLSPERRALLNSTLLSRTIRILKSVPEINQVIVISRDSAALSIARGFGIKTIQEESALDLNRALNRAASFVKANKISSVIIIPSDLPLFEASDISAMLDLRTPELGMIITPDRRNQGTNSLYLCPPDGIKFRFGNNSFALHMDEAKINNITYQIYNNPNLALDIDIPQDLELLKTFRNVTLLEELMLDDIFEPSEP